MMGRETIRKAAIHGSQLSFDGRTIEGYAAVFGVVDGEREVIQKGAFRKTLQEGGHRVKALWQHDRDKPLGPVLELREDDYGLYVKFAISETSYGNDIVKLLKDYQAVGEEMGLTEIFPMSFFADVVNSRREKRAEKAVRVYSELKLHDVSLVTFPGNESATALLMKAGLLEGEGEPEPEPEPEPDGEPTPETLAKEFLADGSVVIRMGTALRAALTETVDTMTGSWLAQGLLPEDIHGAVREALGEAVESVIQAMPEETRETPLSVVPDWLGWITMGGEMMPTMMRSLSKDRDDPEIDEPEDEPDAGEPGDDDGGRAEPDDDPLTHPTRDELLARVEKGKQRMSEVEI